MHNPQLRCTVTSHELPAREDALQAHIQGKRFKKLLAQKAEIIVPPQFSEFLVPHAKLEYVLWSWPLRDLLST